MNILQLAKFTVFLSGTLLHESVHYTVAKSFAEDVNFRLPISLYQAQQMSFRDSMDFENINVDNRFGVEATWSEGSSPIPAVLYLVAPLVFLPFAYLFLNAGLNGLTTNLTSVIAWIQFFVGIQFAVAFMPSRDDFEELHKILSRTDYQFRIRWLGRSWSIGNKD